MDLTTFTKIIPILKRENKQWPTPVVSVFAAESENRAYDVLVSTLLSLRTKDAVTKDASIRLLEKAPHPQALLKLKLPTIEKLIYPVGFYRNKAKQLKKIAEILLEKYEGNVPRKLEQLLELPGVGRKTANLVLTDGFNDYGICVDTHVHRIFNRWGFLKTKTPDETEMELRDKLPKKYWKQINEILVTYGQNLCVPVSPKCSECKIKNKCPRLGVNKSR